MPDSSRAQQARTRLARRAVLDAARALFLERGYGATTIEAISTTSDVPQATVYRLFSSKPGILKALLDASIAGDDEPVPVADRLAVRSRLEVAEPRDRLAGLAAISVEINREPHPSTESSRALLAQIRPPRSSSMSSLANDNRAKDESRKRWRRPQRCGPACETRRGGHHPRAGLTGGLPLTRHRPEVVRRPL